MTTLGYVTILQNQPTRRVVAILTDRPTITRGARWVDTARTRRKSISEYGGAALDVMTVPIMLDGFRTGASVQDDWDTLVGMMDPAGPNAVEPMPVTVDGAMPGTGRQWLVNGVDPTQGGAITRGGVLIRQSATVTLLEANAPTVLVATVDPSTVPAHYTLHTAKKGDTLTKLSTAYYGTTKKWRAIGNAQTPPIRDANAAITPGRTLRIP